MSKSMVNHLKKIDVAENLSLRDFQHASRLYLSNDYDFVPKAGWLYYIEIKINAELQNVISNPQVKLEFQEWYDQYKGQIGLLAKSVDLPKFTIDTEIINQYNKKTVVQKGINYGSIGITFHDDMANATTNLWKSYYQYYYGDSIDSASKYRVGIYDSYKEGRDFRFGLNNLQTIPFFTSFVFYQLYQKKFTKFEVINPLIKSWSHDSLDQTSADKMLTSNMDIDYETLVYDTGIDNLVTSAEPGFNDTGRYDNTISPLKLKVQSQGSQRPDAGRKSDIFGKTKNPKPNLLGTLNRTNAPPQRVVKTANPPPVTQYSNSRVNNGVISTQHTTQQSPVNISVSVPNNPNNVTESRASNAYRPPHGGGT